MEELGLAMEKVGKKKKKGPCKEDLKRECMSKHHQTDVSRKVVGSEVCTVMVFC